MPKKWYQGKPKKADVRKTCFLNDSSLTNGKHKIWTKSCRSIGWFWKTVFEIFLTSALYFKISYLVDFCWFQQSSKKRICQSFSVTDVQFKKQNLLTSAFFLFFTISFWMEKLIIPQPFQLSTLKYAFYMHEVIWFDKCKRKR